MKRESGFTLIEVLAAMALASIVMTLGASAFRHYWMVRSLAASQDLVVTQLRAMQERAVSESHPLVFGARFAPGATEFTLVKYDPKASASPTDDVCVNLESYDFEGGVKLATASFASRTDLDVSKCPDAAGASYAFFYAKGTATAGSLELSQPIIDRTQGLQVSALTGRVKKT